MLFEEKCLEGAGPAEWDEELALWRPEVLVANCGSRLVLPVRDIWNS